MQTAPKYDKIELYNHEGEILATHNDCGMFITAELIVIVEVTNDSIQNAQVTEGITYSLKDVKRYKTYGSNNQV